MPWHNLPPLTATIMLARCPIELCPVSSVILHPYHRRHLRHVSPETNRQPADAMSKAFR